MKKINTIFLNLFLCTFVLLNIQCKKENSFNKSSENKIQSLLISYTDSLIYGTFKPIDSLTAEIIRFEVKKLPNVSRKRMKIDLSIPASAIVEPAIKGTNDLSVPFVFYVISENGERKKYILDVYEIN